MHPPVKYVWLLLLQLFLFITSCSNSAQSMASQTLAPGRFFQQRYQPLGRAILDEDLRAIEANAYGLDLNQVHAENMTLLFYASWHRKKDAFRRLLELGADPNLMIAGQGTMVNFAAKDPDPEYMQILLEHGGDPNAKMQSGDPVAIYALMHGPFQTVRNLVWAGADVNGRDKDGDTILMTAVAVFKFAEARELLDMGADPKLKNNMGANVKTYLEGRNPEVGSDAYRQKETLVAKLQAMGVWNKL